MDFLKDLEIDNDIKQKLEEQFKSVLEETTKGLKANNDSLLSEKKKALEAAEQAQQMAKQETEEKLKASNNYKQLFESQNEEANRLKKLVEDMKSQSNQQRVKSEASIIASSLTKDKGRHKLLEKELSQRLTLVDDQIRVVDESGQLTVSTLEELTNRIKMDYPFLIDGSQASGGGAARSSGGAGVIEKTISRSEFDAMRPRDKSAYIKSGGTITD